MNGNRDTGAPAAGASAYAVFRRPQRTLTPADYEAIHGTALLNLHAALIMGIVDPVPNPSRMSEVEGARVREHVWPAHCQPIERKYPFGFYRWANCERGTCWNCLADRCDLCVHRQDGGPHVDNNVDWVWSSTGQYVARLILRPGGEPCVWWCRCSCPKEGPAPAGPARGAAADVLAKPGAELPSDRRRAPRGEGNGQQEALF